MRELFEIRSSLEAGAAPFLVSSVMLEGLALLRKIHWQMEVEDHEENFSALDRQFHTELLRMMRNRILDRLLPFIIDFFNELRKQKKLRLWKMTPYRKRSPNTVRFLTLLKNGMRNCSRKRSGNITESISNC
ncbi:MAG: FCD domain-containing protein [Victivallales bacterium]